MTEKKSLFLIPETFPLKMDRKGGAANLLLTALLVEAGRMLDEERDIPTIEAAAKRAFISSEGFLSRMDEIGIEEAVAMMSALSDTKDRQDPILLVYDNFFSPPKCFLSRLEQYKNAGDRSVLKWVSDKDALKGPEDILVLELLTKRFQAVAFMVAVELADAGVAGIQDLDRFCRTEFGWKEGPFSMMNRIGIEEALQMVIEKIDLSCQSEINFPVPKLMIKQAQLRIPWPLNSGA
jgi:3-hydroxyacyl-CoA dehydrogenase